MLIKYLDEIWTADGFKLGVARRLHYRPEEEVNPDEQLYAAYLEVENFELGDDYYVPIAFIAGRDESTDRILLAVSMRKVMQHTWSRAPEFVAKCLGRAEPLPREMEGEPDLT